MARLRTDRRIVVAFVALWMRMGDPIDALLLLIVFVLVGALLLAVATYLIVNIPWPMAVLRIWVALPSKVLP